jgi:hypothetical protein
MLITFADREELVRAIGPGHIDTMVELGVWEGEFSAHCEATLQPRQYTLIDFWRYDRYSFVLEDAPQMREVRSIYSQYFHGDPEAALEAAYQKVQERFRNKANVTILRADIAEAASGFPDGGFDFIYLDGNHTYEYVLRDLLLWFPKLRKGGLFVCNDFFEADIAAPQNIGVIPAWTTFSKRARTYPIMVSSGAWSDFYFSNQPVSPLIDHFRAKLCAGPYAMVEIPDDILPAFQHRLIRVDGVPVRLLPSFRAGSHPADRKLPEAVRSGKGRSRTRCQN